MRATLSSACCALVLMIWAVPNVGAAHFTVGQAQAVTTSTIAPASFRTDKERGLLVRVWIGNKGPFIFALDTGAGLNLITAQAANDAQVSTRRTGATVIAGLSNARVRSTLEATLNQIAIGGAGNKLPTRQTALVVPNLAPGIDGVLDPTLAFSPYGYTIDLPNERLIAGFGQLGAGRVLERATVAWVRRGNDDRPFVRLGDGRIALIDTGSGFGLAVNGRGAVVVGGRPGQSTVHGVRDIGGGMINARRVAPTTVSIGDLVLRRIPTDILYGVDSDAPVIIGRDALYPFRISFDPQRRQIEFVALDAD